MTTQYNLLHSRNLNLITILRSRSEIMVYLMTIYHLRLQKLDAIKAEVSNLWGTHNPSQASIHCFSKMAPVYRTTPPANDGDYLLPLAPTSSAFVNRLLYLDLN